MPAEIATAYVSIIPSLQGAKGKIAQQLGDEGTAGGKRFNTALSAGIGAGVGTVAAFALAPITNAIGGLVGEATAASDAVQKFQSTLTFAHIGTDQIAALTKSTQKYANETVYGIADIQGITAQLASNGVKGFDRLAEAAGNLNSIAGGTAETYKSVGMVLTQTAGQGKLTTENFNQLSDAIPGASGRIQAALLQAKAYTGNFRDAMAKGQITAQEFNDAILSLGFEPAAVAAAKSTATIEGAFGNLQATVVTVLSNVINFLKPTITTAAGFVSAAVGQIGDKLPAVFEKVGPALKPLTDLLDASAKSDNPIGTFIDGIVKASPVLTILKGVFDGIAPVLPQIQAGFAQIGSVIAGDLVKYAPLIATAFGQVVTAIVPLIPKLLELIPAILPIIPPLLDLIQQVLPPLVDFLGVILPPAISGVTAAVQVLAPVLGGIVGFFSGAAESVSTFADLLLKGADPSTIISQLTAIKGPFGDFNRFLVDVGHSIGQFVVDASAGFTRFRTAVSDGVGAVVSFVTGVPGRVVAAVGNLGQTLFGKGRDLIQGLINGASSLLSNLGKFFLDRVPDFIREPFKQALGIHSPSTVFAGFGANIGQGLIQGMQATQGAVAATVQDLVPAPASLGLMAGGAALVSPGVGGVQQTVMFNGAVEDPTLALRAAGRELNRGL